MKVVVCFTIVTSSGDDSAKKLCFIFEEEHIFLNRLFNTDGFLLIIFSGLLFQFPRYKKPNPILLNRQMKKKTIFKHTLDLALFLICFN